MSGYNSSVAKVIYSKKAVSQYQAQIDPETGYITNIDAIRASEYPNLEHTTYLDHAGTTLIPKSLIERFSGILTQNIFGNPHSASAASQLSTRSIDDVRLQVLRFFKASPDVFDVVFLANATAAIKLVADAFRDHDSGFWYGYHVDSHTSLVGVRELATCGSRCLTDTEFEETLAQVQNGVISEHELWLLAYPGQSNMTGKRLDLDWCRRIRSMRASHETPIYSLFDAAALVSTSPLDLSDASTTPDFVALSFYKIFGFPDLGALLIRKDCGEVFKKRKYFGGGTTDAVVVHGDPWHASKDGQLHSRLEDGTVAFHNILALQSAFETHLDIYGSMQTVFRHTRFLAHRMKESLLNLRHRNGTRVCLIYMAEGSGDSLNGPVIAFNLLTSSGTYFSISEVEKLAIVRGIQLRTGGLCNPGGITAHLGLSAREIRSNYSSGHRCGSSNDIVNGKPTGMLRISFGAMSSMRDVTEFLRFITEFCIENSSIPTEPQQDAFTVVSHQAPQFVIESLVVFPIKSCGAYQIPAGTKWEVRPRGLALDREWCLVHQGTFAALSQKRYPRMALLKPAIDRSRQILTISHNIHGTGIQYLDIDLDSRHKPTQVVKACDVMVDRTSSVCGEDVEIEHYVSTHVSSFFTDALGVACTLARFPRDGKVRQAQVRIPATANERARTAVGKPISLSNESPILLVSRSSVNRLNEQIKCSGGVGQAVTAESFRGNIVIREELSGDRSESPYAEDHWTSMRVGTNSISELEVLGPCQRCQMVCVDQKSAKRNQEPFSTLAKTRRKGGRVWFGMHICLSSNNHPSVYIQAGDPVTGYIDEK